MDTHSQHPQMTSTAQAIIAPLNDLPERHQSALVNAPLWKRGGAYLIDIAFVAPFYLFFFFLLTTTPVPPEERTTVTLFAVATSILLTFMGFGYFIYLEGRGGATIGKRIMRIRVVSADGSECGFSQSIVRGIFRVVDIFLWPLIFFSPKRLRVGDRLAKTWVVRAV